jgi:type IV pilus assembly protein PilZ
MIKRPGGPRGGMLTLHLNDKNILYASYLSFLKNGGLFVPTDKPYRLGDDVFIALTLMGEKMPVAGKVVWINPKGVQGGRPAGIGVQFGDLDQGKTRNEIEKQLTGSLTAERPTYTM